MTANRTGPLGRLARLLLAAALGFSLSTLLDEGGVASFRNPSVLGEWSVWLLDAVMLILFVQLAFRVAASFTTEAAARRWQAAAFALLAAAVGAAAWIGRTSIGAAWGSPLADLVWWFDALMLIETIAALLLAACLGTPGCEIGVWPELIMRIRGGAAAPVAGLDCLVGLHFLDAWEARRRGREGEPGET